MSSVLKEDKPVVPDPYALPLKTLDPAKTEIFQQDKLWGYFERLRKEDPVHWFDRTQGVPFWAITKHADIVSIGKQPEKFLNGPRLVIEHQPLPADREEFPPTLIQLDPPKHGIYRQLVSKRFTPRYLKRMHADIERIGGEIVDKLVERSDEGECDFVREVSAPLPIAVIAWMLGVPESDWGLLFDWTNRTIGAGDPEYQEEGKNSQETARQAMVELFTYFTKLVEEKKKNPTDDLITIFATAEVDGAPLPFMDVLAWCLIIVVAGNETTRNGTTGGMLAFVENQDQLRKLQADMSLLPSAVEEVVRWTSPIIHFARTATEDVEIRGTKIPALTELIALIASANRGISSAPVMAGIERLIVTTLILSISLRTCSTISGPKSLRPQIRSTVAPIAATRMQGP